ncbi:MAG: hypothetical protein Q9M39_05530 [Sulfurovum sp.]|nr:hypothetical protein [Sulfurovum sp.]
MINRIDAASSNPINGNTITKADEPNDNLFIFSADDWRVNPDRNLWVGENAPNQVCPKDWRLGTEQEWLDIRDGGGGGGDGSLGSFLPPTFLHLTVTGWRDNTNGLVFSTGAQGEYWTSTVRGAGAQVVRFESYATDSFTHANVNAFANPVRCRYVK